MQIIKPPLGIKAPLLGLSDPLSMPSLLLRKEHSFQPLLSRFIKPLAAIQGVGLSQNRPLIKAFEFLPTSENKSLIKGNTELSSIEFDPIDLINIEQHITHEEEELTRFEIYLDSQIDTNILKQEPTELTTQKSTKSKKNKKQAKPKSKSTSRAKSKKAVALAAEKVYQSLDEISTGSSVNGDEWVADSQPLPAVPHFDALAANLSPSAPQRDIDSDTNTNESTENAPVLAVPPLLIEGEKIIVSSIPANSRQAAAFEPLPAVPNLESLDAGSHGPKMLEAINLERTEEGDTHSDPNLSVNTTGESTHILHLSLGTGEVEPPRLRSQAQPGNELIESSARLTTGARSESTASEFVMAAPAVPTVGDSLTLFSSPTDAEQPTTTKPVPAVSSTEALAIARRPNAVQDIDLWNTTGESTQSTPTLSHITTGESTHILHLTLGTGEVEPPRLRSQAEPRNELIESSAGLATGARSESTASEFVMAAPALPTAGDSLTLFSSPAEAGLPAAAEPVPAVPRTEALAIARSPDATEDINLGNTTDEFTQSAPTLPQSTTDNSTETAPMLATPTLPTPGDKPSLFRSPADSEQVTAFESLPAVPNVDSDTGSHSPKMPEAINPTLFSSPTNAEQPAAAKPVPAVSSTQALAIARSPDVIEEATPTTKADRNTTFDSLPPAQGFAVGGLVAVSDTVNSQQIAPSDIVPAMLTPGEFVVNTKDAQKNFNLLRHINSGGTVAEELIPSSIQTPEPKDQGGITSTETSTKVDFLTGSSVQRKESEVSLPIALKPLATSSTRVGRRNTPTIPSRPLLESGQHNLSTLNSLQSNSFDNRTTETGERSTHYSSTPLIFRKRNSDAQSPSQWSSIEDLLSGSGDAESFDEFTPLSFGSVEVNRQDAETSTVSESSRAFSNRRLPPPRGFAAGGEVTASDISTTAQPITKTIERPSSDGDADSPDLEELAREIYQRLRQRLEVERERHGFYSGRLPW